MIKRAARRCGPSSARVEEYYQKYYANNPYEPYCTAVATEKPLAGFRPANGLRLESVKTAALSAGVMLNS